MPLLVGYADAEGVLSTILERRTGGEPIHKNFEQLVPRDFNLERGSEKSKKIAQEIKEYYYGDKNPSLETLDIYVKVN